jgi:hypothetical protein
MEELLALVQTLQGQVAVVQTLQGQVAALAAAVAAASAPIAVPAPVAAPAPVAFADTPQTLGADELIDHSSKRGSDIYKQGIAPLDDKALTDGFNMTTGQTIVFTEAFLSCAPSSAGTIAIAPIAARPQPSRSSEPTTAIEPTAPIDAKKSPKKKWGAKSPDNEKIVAMAAEIKSWKKIPPKSGDSKEKKQGDYTYHWCKHHMAWTIHKPADCRLGKKHKEEQKPAIRANSATLAAAAATAVNPHYAALLATLSNLKDDE